jgi:hypothetical protein
MTDRDSPRDETDPPRPKRRRRNGPRDPARVAENEATNALQPAAESSYRAASAGPSPAATASQPPDRNRAIALRLTAPITDKQHRQAVDLLAAMIVSWVERNIPEPDDEKHQTP